MKKLLLLLMLVPAAFAAWESTAALGIVVSATILGILYAIGFGFGISELQMTAKEEFFQLIALMVMMVVLVGTNGLINQISSNEAFAQDSSTLQDAAKTIVSDSKAQAISTFNSIAGFDLQVSKEASKAAQCSFMGIGYSVSACGGHSMLATPLSMAGGIAGFAISELSAMEKLLEISMTYALNFILPLGIVLRTFKLTRGAGGFLIALAVSMHILLPAGVVFNEMLGITFKDDALADEYEGAPTATVVSCNAASTTTINGGPVTVGDFSYSPRNGLLTGAEVDAINTYAGMRQDIKKYMYEMLIRSTMGPVLALMMMIAGLRAISALAGADVDVSPIARFV